MKDNVVLIIALLILTGLLVLTGMSLAAEDTWFQKAPMPNPGYGLSSCMVNGRICAIRNSDSRWNVGGFEGRKSPCGRKWNEPLEPDKEIR